MNSNLLSSAIDRLEVVYGVLVPNNLKFSAADKGQAISNTCTPTNIFHDKNLFLNFTKMSKLSLHLSKSISVLP